MLQELNNSLGFGCGKNNPHGLKLTFQQEGEWVKTTFLPNVYHQGYPGLVHGGIISTALDEVMSWCMGMNGYYGFTARLEVRYRQGIPINKPVNFKARVLRKKGRLVELESLAINEEGKIMAEGKGKFMISFIKDEKDN